MVLKYVTKKLISRAGIDDELFSPLAALVGAGISSKVLTPRIKFWMKETFNFNSSEVISRIDQLHQRKKELLIARGDKIDWFSSDKIITALVGGTIGGIGGSVTTEKPNCQTTKFENGRMVKEDIPEGKCNLKKIEYQKQKKSNRGTGILFGAVGTYLVKVMAPKHLSEAEAIKINNELLEIDKEIKLLSARASGIQSMQDHRIVDMVKSSDENGEVYQVNEDIANGYISGNQYAKEKIASYEFKGQYKALLGTPGTNFYMIVTGSPGHGKSTFCAAFAQYFHMNHGQTLYLPAEQPNMNKDFQSLIDRTKAYNVVYNYKANMMSLEDVVREIKLRKFKLVVFDSINYMKFTPNDINMLRQRCPEVAIVAVMQSTKDGKFRGSQEYKHDCDIFLKARNRVLVPEKTRGSASSIEIPLDAFI